MALATKGSLHDSCLRIRGKCSPVRTAFIQWSFAERWKSDTWSGFPCRTQRAPYNSTDMLHRMNRPLAGNCYEYLQKGQGHKIVFRTTPTMVSCGSETFSLPRQMGHLCFQIRAARTGHWLLWMTRMGAIVCGCKKMSRVNQLSRFTHAMHVGDRTISYTFALRACVRSWHMWRLTRIDRGTIGRSSSLGWPLFRKECPRPTNATSGLDSDCQGILSVRSSR